MTWLESRAFIVGYKIDLTRRLAAIMQRFERFSLLPTAFAQFSLFPLARGRICGNEPEVGVEKFAG